MNRSQPLVSIIMPAYNSEKYIAASIQSIINQTYTNWELIIINDGSKDNTLSIIKKYLETDSRITLIDQSENQGLIATRNKGLSNSKGKYIALLDSDDLAMSNRLEKQVHFLEQEADYVLLGAACYEIDENGQQLSAVERDIPNEQLSSLLLFSNYFINSTVVMRSDVAKQISYQKGYAPAEDYQFFYQLSKLGKIGNLKDKLVEYRIHDQNISKIKQVEQDEAIKQNQKVQLQALGIFPNEDEVKLHASLVAGPYANSAENLRFAEEWLLKLIEANEKSNLYPENIFNFFCGFFFRRYCQNSKKGSQAILKFAKSPLFKFVKNDIKGNSIFFVKSILNGF